MAVLNLDFIADKNKGKAPLIVTFIPIIDNNIKLDDNVDFITFDTGEDYVENNNINDFVDF